MAQSEMVEPPRVRHRRLVRPGRNAAASRGVVTRLLYRWRQAYLCRPGGHWDVWYGPCRSAAPPGAAQPRQIVPPPRTTRFGSPLVLSRVHWVEPKLVAEITYLTWTADGLLRHTVYVGLREDKPADQVRREAAARG